MRIVICPVLRYHYFKVKQYFNQDFQRRKFGTVSIDVPSFVFSSKQNIEISRNTRLPPKCEPHLPRENKKPVDKRKQVPIFDTFWSDEECSNAKLQGHAVSGRLFQHRFEAVVKFPPSTNFACSQVRIPDALAKNRAIHGDIVCVLLNNCSTTNEANQNKETGMTNKYFNTETVSETDTTFPTGRVVGIERLDHRDEIFGSPKQDELKLVMDGNIPYAVFYPRDFRYPPFRIKVEENVETTLQRESDVAISSETVPQATLPLDCLRFLWDEFENGREPIVSIRPLNRWSRYSRYPDGSLTTLPNWDRSVVGYTGNFRTESSVCLHANGLEWRDWEPLPELEKTINASINGESVWLTEALLDPKRRDLRHEPIFTIDPPDSKDLDDAIHVKQLENNKYLLGIHIADVSHFVKKGDPIDREARKRICTAYHGSRIVPMLPEILSNHACSLLPYKDRLAISILITLNKDGTTEPSNPAEVVRSIIRSKCRLSYGLVDAYINRKNSEEDGNLRLPLTIRNQIDILNEVTEQIHQRKGILEFSTCQGYRFDHSSSATDWPDEMTTGEKHPHSHRLIEQCMVLANNMAAEHILLASEQHSTAGILRTQEPNEKALTENIQNFIPLPYRKVAVLSPSMTSAEMLNSLKEKLPHSVFLAIFRRLFDLLGTAQYVSAAFSEQNHDSEPSEELNSESLKTRNGNSYATDDIMSSFNTDEDDRSTVASEEELSQLEVNEISAETVNDLTIHDIRQRLKEIKVFQHTRLLLSAYTHFTSPIRRYADLVVHRILSSAIDGIEAPYEDMRNIAEICTSYNKKHKQKHPNGYLADNSVVIKIITSGSLSKHESCVSDASCSENKKNSKSNILPPCEVTILVPEANCQEVFRTSWFGVVVAGTTNGNMNDLYECTLSGKKGTFKIRVGSKFPVLILPGAHQFRIEMPNLRTYPLL